LDSLAPYASSWFKQTYHLSKRAGTNFLRNPMTTYVALFQTCFMALLVGLVYLQVGLTPESVQNRFGALFFVITNQAFSTFASLNLFVGERDIFKRERASGTYRTSAYFFSKTLVETPLSIIFPLIFTLICYWMIGFQNTAEKFAIFLVTLIIYVTTAGSLMISIGSVSPSLEVATILAPVTLVIFLLFGGFYVNNASIPNYYIWLKYISFFRYGFSILTYNEFSGLNFTCPTNDPNCVLLYPTGESFLQFNDLENVNILEDLLILVAMIVVYRLIAFIALLFQHEEN